MAATVLNEAQLELLRMVSVFNSPEGLTWDNDGLDGSDVLR
jgi:hypothetical protein